MKQLLSDLCYMAAFWLAMYGLERWLDDVIARRQQQDES